MKQKRQFADFVVARTHIQGDKKHALPTRKSIVFVEIYDIFNLSAAVRNNTNVTEDHTER